MSQTSINPAGQPIAVAGQVSDNSDRDIISRFNGEATTRLGFGLGVKQGTNDHEAKQLAAIADVVQGIVKWSANHVPGVTGDLDQTSTPPGLKPAASMELIRRGRVWVQLDVTGVSIVPGVTRAWCRFRTDGASNTLPGTWGTAQDGASNLIDCRKNCVFVGGARVAADGTAIAELEVNFTVSPT